MNDAIFLAFDDTYSLYARACLNSLRANYHSYPQLVVYYNGVNPEILSFVSSFERLTLVTAGELPQIDETFRLGEVNAEAVYFKYLCWDQRFADYRNVLYLDVDTLVLKPLTALFEQNSFYAAPNHDSTSSVRILNQASLHEPGLVTLLAQDGLTLPNEMDDMCNAGVLLIPAEYRTRKQYELLLDITHRYNKYLQYADQSAISLWCKLNSIEFSRNFGFNFQAVHFGSEVLSSTQFEDISILHFSSRRKPNTVEFMLWERIPLAHRKRLAKLFMDYLTETVTA